jgi:Berberine and berberine like
MAPWATGGHYLNFAEVPRSGDELFGAATHARLRQVKAVYDPYNVIRANHPLMPAQA